MKAITIELTKGYQFNYGDKRFEITSVDGVIYEGRNVTKSGFGSYKISGFVEEGVTMPTVYVFRNADKMSINESRMPSVTPAVTKSKVVVDMKKHDNQHIQAAFQELKAIGMKFDGVKRVFYSDDADKNQVSNIMDAYYGKQRSLTPWQRTAKAAIKSLLDAGDEDYLFYGKDSDGVFFSDAFGLDSEGINERLNKIGVKVTKSVNGIRHYYEKF